MTARVFISHSSAENSFTAEFRDALYEELQGVGLEPLLDAERLEPGVRWRTKLFTWMATCEGAVLLLDEGGLSSEWVRTESAILAWRAALDPNLRLFPVLIDQPRSALNDAGLSPVKIDELQLIRSKDRTARELARSVAGQMKDLQPRSDNGPMALWVKQVVEKLSGNEWLDNVADLLGIEQQDRSLPGLDPRYPIAHRLLHSDPAEVERAFDLLAAGMNDHDRCRLGGLLSSSWLPEVAAAALLVAVTEGESRVAELEAALTLTAKRLIVRATCASPFVRVIEPPSPEGAGELAGADLVERYKDELLRVYGAGRPGGDVRKAEASYHATKPHLFVVIEDAAENGDVLTDLHREFERVLFVYSGPAADRETARPALLSVGASVVAPSIDPELEESGWYAANRMEGVG